MKLLIKGGRVVDPASGRDEVGDVFISDGKISGKKEKADQTIDAKGLVVAPGLIDLSARLREPGQEYKATLASEMDAAVAGGVTSLACPPDTHPPLDEPGLVDMLRRRAKALARARVYPVGALTVKLAGERLTEMSVLARGGLRGVLAGQRADHRHAGAVARAAVRRDLRLSGLAARRGPLAGARRRRARRRGGDAPGPGGHSGVRGNHRARHACCSWCAPPARACISAGCPPRPASR